VRIGFDARCLQTASAGGGIGRYARGLAETLPAVLPPGGELLLYLSSYGADPGLPARPGVRVERRRRPARGLTLWDPVLWPARFRRDGIDLFHSPFYGIPARAGRPGDARTVLTVHDLIPLRYPEAVTPRQRAVFARTYRTSLSADRVIVPSRATREDLVERIGVDRARIAVIPLGLSAPFSGEAAGETTAEARRALGQKARERLTRGRPYLLHVGGFDPLKNLEQLIEAFARLLAESAPGADARNLCLVIAGEPGSRAKGAAVREAIERRGVGQQVVLPGRLTDEKLRDALFGAELFVFPSRSEGFGLPPLEAMACGCPVVASDGGSLAEVLEDAALIVREPGTPAFASQFAAAIARLLDDSALRARLVEAGRARAARLTWDEAARRTAQVYLEALEA
jgi:alpha-1,3-rhamnosyl/mannosyltransferase